MIIKFKHAKLNTMSVECTVVMRVSYFISQIHFVKQNISNVTVQGANDKIS